MLGRDDVRLAESLARTRVVVIMHFVTCRDLPNDTLSLCTLGISENGWERRPDRSLIAQLGAD